MLDLKGQMYLGTTMKVCNQREIVDLVNTKQTLKSGRGEMRGIIGLAIGLNPVDPCIAKMSGLIMELCNIPEFTVELCNKPELTFEVCNIPGCRGRPELTLGLCNIPGCKGGPELTFEVCIIPGCKGRPELSLGLCNMPVRLTGFTVELCRVNDDGYSGCC